MSKTYSSFEDQHMLFENWRRYTTEPEVLTEAQVNADEILAALDDLRKDPEFIEVVKMMEGGEEAVPLKRAAEAKEPQLVMEIALTGIAGIPYFLEVIDNALRKLATNKFVAAKFPGLGVKLHKASREILMLRSAGRAWYDTVARDERLKTVPWYADIIKMIGSGLLTQPYLRAVPLHMGDAFWPNVASGVRAAVEILDISLDAVQSTLQKDDGGKAFFEYVKDHIAPIDAELAEKLRHEIDYSEELSGLVVKSMIGQYEELFDTRGAIEKRAPRAAGGLRGKLKPKDIKRLAPIKGTLKPPPKPPKLDFTKPPPPPKKKK